MSHGALVSLPVPEIEWAADRLRESVSAGRKPVLIVGSGLLHQFNFGPFADWSILLHDIAAHLQLPFQRAFAQDYPTHYLESLLVRAAAARNRLPSRVEADIRRRVATTVRGASTQVRTECMELVRGDDSVQSIVSLNFTGFPFLDDSTRVSCGGRIPNGNFQNRTIWFPHGHYDHPKTIQLGIRGYVKMATWMNGWWGEYHQGKGAAAMIERSPTMPSDLQFFADILECPLVFVGCGLRDPEWSLWWLLSTKARNQARHNACPNILVTADDLRTSHIAALEAMGCVVVRVQNYPLVWETVTRLVRDRTSGCSRPGW